MVRTKKANSVPGGLKIISVFFAIIGAALLYLSVPELFDYRGLAGSLERSGITLPQFLLTNIAFPAAMVAASYGLWTRRSWAWWICAIVVGMEVSKKLYLVLLMHQSLLGTFPVKANLSLLIAGVILVFLFTQNVFRAFHGQTQTRLRTFGIVAAVSLVIMGLFIWQSTLSAGT